MSAVKKLTLSVRVTAARRRAPRQEENAGERRARHNCLFAFSVSLLSPVLYLSTEFLKHCLCAHVPLSLCALPCARALPQLQPTLF